jgi:hypothetical protein
LEIEKGHCSFGLKLAGPKSEIGQLLHHGHGGGGRLILVMTGGEVGRGGALGLHGEVGDLLEVHWGGGLTGWVVSMGMRLGQRGMAVTGGVRWWWSTPRGSGR